MRWPRLTLVITEAFVALSAFAAGAMFMVEPSGRLMGMSEDTLARSPFGSYLGIRCTDPVWKRAA